MKPTPLLCWGLARLFSDLSINGELDCLEGCERRLCDHLAGIPFRDRNAAFLGFLESVPPEEQSAIEQGIDDAKPDGPPPEDAGGDEIANPVGAVVKMTCAAGITPRNVEWLWSGRVPLGMLTLFAGDPKLGKSYVTLAIAAAVSRAVPLPGGDTPEGPGSVIIMSAEDDPSRTIVPRLKATGADLNRIHILESIIIPGDSSNPKRSLPATEQFPSLRHDLDRIEAAAAGLGDCKLIVVDPVSAYLGGIDDHRNAELRGILSPVKAMARAPQCRSRVG